MAVILSHSGKQHSYHLARSLQELECLEKFYTSSYVTSELLQNLLEKSGNTFWSRRFLRGLGGREVESNWRFEIPEMIRSKLYGPGNKTSEAVYQRDVKFDRYMASRIRKLKGNIFWGFQGSCYDSLAAAKASGKLSICELATAHAPAARRILEEEKKLHPEWADSIDNVEFPEAYYQRLCEEPHRADIVVGASNFTLNTLRDDGVAETKLKLLPLGFETDHIPFDLNYQRPSGPLRLLFAGRVTQRKGIKYLLEAMSAFDKQEVELHIIGYVHGSGHALRQYDNFILHPPLQQYELFKKYKEFDAFVLPTVFEGFGLVIVEAMAAGLPVITTPHSIGPDVIIGDKNGFIVAIRDIEGIKTAVRKLLLKNESQMSEMRMSARESALNFTWSCYRENLHRLLLDVSKSRLF